MVNIQYEYIAGKHHIYIKYFIAKTQKNYEKYYNTPSLKCRFFRKHPKTGYMFSVVGGAHRNKGKQKKEDIIPLNKYSYGLLNILYLHSRKLSCMQKL